MKAEYDSIKDEYLDFLKEVRRVVEKLLIRHAIPVAFNLSGRLKDYDSIEEKVNSKRFTVKKTITELNDLVGLRIVLLFPEFKDQVIDLLQKEFKRLDSKKEIVIVDKFGYSSAHLILAIKEEWLQTPDWKEHANKKIEVQIRTLSEHIWAETSHTLFYKREENIPKVITRDLHRLSALLEVVDEKLQNLKNRISEHFEYIKNCPYEEILTLDLNSETFRRVMLKNSEGLYNLNDNKNKELSSRIEHEYDIHNTRLLDDLIVNKIDLKECDNEIYINAVLRLLEAEKKRIEEKQGKT